MMHLRFDQHTHEFEEPASPDAPIATSVKHLLQEVAGFGHNTSYHDFNDLHAYLRLCDAHGRENVEIHEINILHNELFCHGINVMYRVYLDDDSMYGNYLPIPSPNRLRSHGYYSNTGGETRETRLTLGMDEFLAEMRVRQGEITDRITLITNKRTISCGGDGGSGDDLSRSVDLSRRIVAFAGFCHNGALHRLGAISIDRNWEVAGPFILLRSLVDMNRATLMEKADDLAAPYESVLQSLIVDTTEDVFRRVLSFLGHGMNVSD